MMASTASILQEDEDYSHDGITILDSVTLSRDQGNTSWSLLQSKSINDGKQENTKSTDGFDTFSTPHPPQQRGKDPSLLFDGKQADVAHGMARPTTLSTSGSRQDKQATILSVPSTVPTIVREIRNCNDDSVSQVSFCGASIPPKTYHDIGMHLAAEEQRDQAAEEEESHGQQELSNDEKQGGRGDTRTEPKTVELHAVENGKRLNRTSRRRAYMGMSFLALTLIGAYVAKWFASSMLKPHPLYPENIRLNKRGLSYTTSTKTVINEKCQSKLDLPDGPNKASNPPQDTSYTHQTTLNSNDSSVEVWSSALVTIENNERQLHLVQSHFHDIRCKWIQILLSLSLTLVLAMEIRRRFMAVKIIEDEPPPPSGTFRWPFQKQCSIAARNHHTRGAEDEEPSNSLKFPWIRRIGGATTETTNEESPSGTLRWPFPMGNKIAIEDEKPRNSFTFLRSRRRGTQG